MLAWSGDTRTAIGKLNLGSSTRIQAQFIKAMHPRSCRVDTAFPVWPGALPSCAPTSGPQKCCLPLSMIRRHLYSKKVFSCECLTSPKTPLSDALHRSSIKQSPTLCSRLSRAFAFPVSFAYRLSCQTRHAEASCITRAATRIHLLM